MTMLPTPSDTYESTHGLVLQEIERGTIGDKKFRRISINSVRRLNTDIHRTFRYIVGGLFKLEPTDLDLNTIDQLYIEHNSGDSHHWQFDLNTKKFRLFFYPDFLNTMRNDESDTITPVVGFTERRQSDKNISFADNNITPKSASLQGNRIYILDAYGHKVYTFDLEGNRVEDEDISLGQGAVTPIAMTVIPHGLAYIGYEDTLHDIRTYYLDTGLEVQYNEPLELNSIDSYIGSFFSHLAFDDEKVYIGRYGNSRIETFNLDGNSRLSRYVYEINRNTTGLEIKDNKIITIENNPPIMKSWAKNSERIHEFTTGVSNPQGVTVDEDSSHIYIYDHTENKVYRQSRRNSSVPPVAFEIDTDLVSLSNTQPMFYDDNKIYFIGSTSDNTALGVITYRYSSGDNDWTLDMDSDDNTIPARLFNLHTNNANPVSIHIHDELFYVYDTRDNIFYVYNNEGVRQTSKEFVTSVLRNNALGSGSDKNSNYFYIYDIGGKRFKVFSNGGYLHNSISVADREYTYNAMAAYNGEIFAVGYDNSNIDNKYVNIFTIRDTELINERFSLTLEEGRTEVSGIADYPLLLGYLTGQNSNDTHPNARVMLTTYYGTKDGNHYEFDVDTSNITDIAMNPDNSRAYILDGSSSPRKVYVYEMVVDPVHFIGSWERREDNEFTIDTTDTVGGIAIRDNHIWLQSNNKLLTYRMDGSKPPQNIDLHGFVDLGHYEDDLYLLMDNRIDRVDTSSGNIISTIILPTGYNIKRMFVDDNHLFYLLNREEDDDENVTWSVITMDLNGDIIENYGYNLHPDSDRPVDIIVNDLNGITYAIDSGNDSMHAYASVVVEPVIVPDDNGNSGVLTEMFPNILFDSNRFAGIVFFVVGD